MNDNLPYYLGFSHFLGIGPVRFKALINQFGTVKEAYRADTAKIKEIIGSNLGEKFGQFRHSIDLIKIADEIKKKAITVITQEDSLYPENLKNIPDPPICLYIKGKLKGLNLNRGPFMAIVGTRKPTAYGEQLARRFGRELARAGFVIVSGMAMGIDAFAHKVALEEGKKTVAFLGCGVDVIYPASNSRLYYQIIDQGGLIISEFPPGRTVLKGLFIARNRLISGLSLGVLVVEGAKDSGALITARYAANQGREVFALPSPLTSPVGEGPNNLIKQGAKLVICVEDIFEEFGLKILPQRKKEMLISLNEEEKEVFNILTEPRLVDEIAVLGHLAIDRVLNILSIFEIRGLIERNLEGKYQIKDSG